MSHKYLEILAVIKIKIGTSMYKQKQLAIWRAVNVVLGASVLVHKHGKQSYMTTGAGS